MKYVVLDHLGYVKAKDLTYPEALNKLNTLRALSGDSPYNCYVMVGMFNDRDYEVGRKIKVKSSQTLTDSEIGKLG